jgi:hypothetical protein
VSVNYFEILSNVGRQQTFFVLNSDANQYTGANMENICNNQNGPLTSVPILVCGNCILNNLPKMTAHAWLLSMLNGSELLLKKHRHLTQAQFRHCLSNVEEIVLWSLLTKKHFGRQVLKRWLLAEIQSHLTLAGWTPQNYLVSFKILLVQPLSAQSIASHQNLQPSLG